MKMRSHFVSIFILGVATKGTWGISHESRSLYIHPSVARRQVQIPAPAMITTSSTYDYWWPYPPAVPPATTTPVTTPTTSVMPTDTQPIPSSTYNSWLLTSSWHDIISSSLDDPSTSLFNNTASIATTSVSSLSPPISSPTASYSPNLTSTVSSSATNLISSSPSSKFKFKSIYLIPLLGLLGVILGCLTAWIIYGCLTRGPRRVRVGDDERGLGGPRYMPVTGREKRRVDATSPERGYYMQRSKESEMVDWRSGWPDYVPDYSCDTDQHLQNGVVNEKEEDPFLIPPLTTGNARSNQTHLSRNWISSRRPPIASSSPSQRSDTTSLALLDLYVSGSEEEEERRKEEPPWESLRHKSIKRGLLNKVMKDGEWRQKRRVERDEGVKKDSFLDGGNDLGTSMSIGKRFGHIREDSDIQVLPLQRNLSSQPTVPALRLQGSRANTSHSNYSSSSLWCNEDGGAGTVSANEAETAPSSAFLRVLGWGSSSNYLNKQDDHYTPMPIRSAASKGRDRSRSTSPTKRSAGPIKSGHDILPASPPQIMSPPLESQLCFTPTPPPRSHPKPSSMLVSLGTRNKRGTSSQQFGDSNSRKPKSRPSVRKDETTGKKLRSPHVPQLPFPGRGKEAGITGANSLVLDMYRGRLMKSPAAALVGQKEARERVRRDNNITENRKFISTRSHPRPSLKNVSQPSSSSVVSEVTTASTETNTSEILREEAKHRVEAIMERSWSQRQDLLGAHARNMGGRVARGGIV